MIQVYKPENTDYEHNGNITLFPTACNLDTEINGAWELSMSHPLDSDGRWEYLSEEAVISAPTFQSDHQLFRVDKWSLPSWERGLKFRIGWGRSRRRRDL